MLREENTFGDVIALTVIDGRSLSEDGCVIVDSQLRIGVRSEQTNLTHPYIVSVPTQRIPRALADAILEGAPAFGKIGRSIAIESQRVSNECQNGHDPVIYAVESLLCSKLGVADALERGEILFEAVPAIYVVSHAHYPNFLGIQDPPYPASELLRMINIRVDIIEGAGLFPERTPSYYHGRWVSAGDFAKMMDGKDVSLVGLPGFEFCVDGLCVATTNEIVSKDLLEVPAQVRAGVLSG